MGSWMESRPVPAVRYHDELPVGDLQSVAHSAATSFETAATIDARATTARQIWRRTGACTGRATVPMA